tara:strand:- start:131 stop:1075 length:945 start_codon:yes stop_codon:yes gene_type:complete
MTYHRITHLFILVTFSFFGCDLLFIDLDDLQDRAGLLYKINTETPFSGKVNYKPQKRDDNTRLGTIKNGKRHGKWYATSKNFYHYNEGIKDGEAVFYKYLKKYRGLDHKANGNFKNDKMIGEWIFYYDDGQVKAMGNYSGKAEYDSEYLGATGIPLNGRIGSWVFYYPSGQKSGEVYYDKNEDLVESFAWHDNGSKQYQKIGSYYLYGWDRDGILTTTNGNGVISRNIKKLRHDMWVKSYDGSTSTKYGFYDFTILEHISDGQIVKEEVFYKEKLIISQSVLNGFLDGEAKYFFDDGSLRATAYYKNGKEIKNP